MRASPRLSVGSGCRRDVFSEMLAATSRSRITHGMRLSHPRPPGASERRSDSRPFRVKRDPIQVVLRLADTFEVCGLPYLVGGPLPAQSVVRPMSGLRARVENGRLILDEPTTLPNGSGVDLVLVLDDQGDDLTDEERRALHEALSTSWKSAEAGRLRPAAEILDELRQRR